MTGPRSSTDSPHVADQAARPHVPVGTPPNAADVRAPDVVAFLGEVVLLGMLIIAGAHLGHGILAVLLAIGLPTVLAALWGRWLAPRASRRLPYPQRLATKLGLVAAAAVLLTVSGSPLWSCVVLAAVAAVFAVAEIRGEHRPAGQGR